jgi:hypothetical protein
MIAVLVIAIILPLALYWRIDVTARTLHENALREQAHHLAEYLKLLPDGRWGLELPPNLRDLYSSAYGRYGFAVLTRLGQSLVSSRTHDEPLFRSDPRRSRTTYFVRHVGTARLFGASVPVQVGSATLWVQISEDEAHRDVLIDDIVAEFLPNVAWVILPILLALFGIDFLIFGQMLRPLEAASARARQISLQRTDLRLPEAHIPGVCVAFGTGDQPGVGSAAGRF